MTDIDLTIPAFLDRTNTLPAMINSAARMLSSATDAAEVLEAKAKASEIYDTAKRAARLAEAKGAHDELVTKLRRAQAKALEIEAAAEQRLADEYDAAQERGEIATGRDGPGAGVIDGNAKATAADIGLSRKDVYEARQIRDAEKAQPGIVNKTLNEALAIGQEPTRAKVKKAVREAVKAVKPRKARTPVTARTWSKKVLRNQICEAITALSGLPAPAEIVGYFSGDDETLLINERLPRAVKWLCGFAELWPTEGSEQAEAPE